MSEEFIVPTWVGGCEKARKDFRYHINAQKRRIVDQAPEFWFEITTNLEKNLVERLFRYTHKQILEEQTTTEVLIEYVKYQDRHVPRFTAIQPRAGKEGKYFVIAGCFLLRFRHLGAAMMAALYLRDRGFRSRKYLDCYFQPQILQSFLETEDKKIVITPDDEYNQIIGQKKEPMVVEYSSPPAAEDAPVDEQLYQEFAKLLDTSISKPSTTVHQYKDHMGGTKIGTEVLTVHNIKDVALRRYKRELTPQQWLEVNKHQVHPLCKLLPKPGTVVGDGEIRTVAAMTPSLEAFLRIFWNGVGAMQLSGYIQNLHEKPDKKFGYDIIRCDDRVGPYFRRYAFERYPNIAEALFPRTIGRSGLLYRTNKLPSGVIHTSIVVNHFTKAFMNVNNIDGVFSGDGILTDKELYHPWLTFTGPNYLNGFGAAGRFENEWKLLEAAWLRGPYRPNGKVRYFLRYYTARHFKAEVDYLPIPPDLEGIDLDSTATQVAVWAQKMGLELGKMERCDNSANVVKTHDEWEVFDGRHLVATPLPMYSAFTFSLPH